MTLANRAGSTEPKLKVLFTTPVLCYPTVGGPTLRIENSIKALSLIAELHLVSRVSYRAMGGADAVAYYRQHCHSFSFAPLRSAWVERWRGVASTRFRSENRWIYWTVNLPLKVVEVLLSALSSVSFDALMIVRYAKRHQIGVVWFGYGNISHALMKEVAGRAPKLKLICDTDSVWSRFLLRELPYQPDRKKRDEIERAGRAKEQEERAWSEFCACVTAVSEVDARYYRKLYSDDGKVAIFSNVVDLEAYKQTVAGVKLHRPMLYLAGTFWAGSPMEHAARWVLTEVLPKLLVKHPSLHLYIVGNRSNEVLADIMHSNVTVTGRVQSVLPYLLSADVVLVPLWFESGTRFKILEAGACRKGVVSTKLGAEGLEVVSGKQILIADTPAEFSAAIDKLLADPALGGRMGDELHDLVRAEYSIDALSRQGQAILNRIAEGKETVE